MNIHIQLSLSVEFMDVASLFYDALSVTRLYSVDDRVTGE
jgi:hypothetical protein